MAAKIFRFDYFQADGWFVGFVQFTKNVQGQGRTLAELTADLADSLRALANDVSYGAVQHNPDLPDNFEVGTVVI